MTNPSKSEIERLGVRLRESVSPDDLRLLDTYHLSFASAYAEGLQAIKTTTGIERSGRPAKSTTAIVDKLSGESIRLSQLQDIAGEHQSRRGAYDSKQIEPQEYEELPKLTPGMLKRATVNKGGRPRSTNPRRVENGLKL